MRTATADRRTLAIDIGGTRTKIGIIVRGTTESVVVFPTHAEDPLGEVAAQGIALLAGGTIDAVGMCVPGIVTQNRVTSLPGKLESIVDVPLDDFCLTRFGHTPVLMNDALAYGIGEARCGQGSNWHRVVVMTIGTGIGVAVLEDGSPLGSGPFGGGILGGQIPIRTPLGGTPGNAPVTIEQACAAGKLVAYAGPHYKTAEQVLGAAAAGIRVATAAVTEYQESLITALVALAHAHGPEGIVVGGGPVSTSHLLLEGVEERVNALLFPGYQVLVRPSTLGDAAALIGLDQLAGEQ